jgi:hypothetical protein
MVHVFKRLEKTETRKGRLVKLASVRHPQPKRLCTLVIVRHTYMHTICQPILLRVAGHFPWDGWMDGWMDHGKYP